MSVWPGWGSWGGQENHQQYWEVNSLALSDDGVYSCSLVNVAGNVTRSVRLKVEGELKVPNL